MFKSLRYWNFRLWCGSIMLVFFLILGFVLPLFLEGNAAAWSTFPRNLKPSPEHFLGTTNLGQDTFWLLTASIHNSFIIGFLVASMATVIGVLVGLIAGFVGGGADRVITLLADSFIVIPSLPILILLSTLLKGNASVLYVSIILIVFNWPWPARQVRSMALSLRERDFISTAIFSGQSLLDIIVKEVLPFVRDWGIANFINTILVAIATESGLAVIGLSSNEKATLGTMIYWANQHQAMLAGRWWWIGSPVVTTALIFISLFLTMTGYQNYNAKRRGKDA
ncbi:MAG: ABC transporter permease [Treponema sp.]|nr:ABC transporter permease [Treponema sp.]